MSREELFGRTLYESIYSRNPYRSSPMCQIVSDNEDTTVTVAHLMYRRSRVQDSEGSTVVETGPVSQSNSR